MEILILSSLGTRRRAENKQSRGPAAWIAPRQAAREPRACSLDCPCPPPSSSGGSTVSSPRVRGSPPAPDTQREEGRRPPAAANLDFRCSGSNQTRKIYRTTIWRKEMPKRRGEGYGQNERHNGDLACKRSRPERRWKHLYLILDDWEKGYSIHKIDLASFDSDSDDNHDSSRVAAVAGHLLELEPPVVRLESPGDVGMLFAAMGNKIFIVTDARYGQTPALIYDTETAALALGPAIPAHRQCGLDTVVAAHGMFYAFSPPACNPQHSFDDEQHSFDVMSWALTATGSRSPAEMGWFWRSLPALPPPFSAYETITSYAVHSDGYTIYMTTSYRDRPGLQKSTYSFNTKYSVWRWHSWALPFSDEGYFDSELDAWVGLRWDGYICCCQLPTDIGSETPIELGTVELDWQLVEDKLFCRETEKYLMASLTYMGRSKFCLIRSAMCDRTKAKCLLGNDESYVLHLTMFGLKYNNKGELRFMNHKTSVSYRVARNTDFFSPVAFWL